MPSLIKHLRVHDKTKPYPCDYPGCGKAFSQVVDKNDGRALT